MRFFSSLRLPQERIGTPEEHLAASVEIASDALGSTQNSSAS